MRRSLAIFLIISLGFVGFLVHSVSTRLMLLVEDGSRDAIDPAELDGPDSELSERRPQLIPKIIHQTYVNESVPGRWKEAQRTCLEWNPDYTYMVRGAVDCACAHG